jgi:predicted MPP superfamily phosphohydrolase
MILAHVSDIHFRSWAGGSPWDVNVPLRTALERDLQSLASELGSFRAIVVTGDIAFSGEHSEYDLAQEWLNHLANLTGCLTQDVWVIPGNHDVDRSKVEASDLIKEFHREMRDCERASIGPLMHQRLADQAAGAVYLSPLDSYVAFATSYGCDISPKTPWWDCAIPFENGGFLRIRGLTSVLISDAMDDQDANRLMLGPAQVALSPLPQTITMTLSHHPLSWLRDEEEILEALDPVAEVQLWGHRHRQATRPMGGNVHLQAGAVHPARGETDWEPRYNLIRMEAPDDSGIATLDVFPRVWRRQSATFGADLNSLEGQVYERHILTLHYKTTPSSALRARDVTQEEMAVSLPVTPAGDPRRRLAFRFGTLPYQRKVTIARELHLLGEEARNLSDRELFELALAEAVAQDRLADLWEAVEGAHGDTAGANPFVDQSPCHPSQPHPPHEGGSNP